MEIRRVPARLFTEFSAEYGADIHRHDYHSAVRAAGEDTRDLHNYDPDLYTSEVIGGLWLRSWTGEHHAGLDVVMADEDPVLLEPLDERTLGYFVAGEQYSRNYFSGRPNEPREELFVRIKEQTITLAPPEALYLPNTIRRTVAAPLLGRLAARAFDLVRSDAPEHLPFGPLGIETHNG